MKIKFLKKLILKTISIQDKQKGIESKRKILGVVFLGMNRS
jgi:hypothetical protein